MKLITLDCRDMTDRAALHALVREFLSLPDYYGNNLDALYDCLTELGEETVLLLCHTEALEGLPDGYGRRFLETLRDAESQIPHLLRVIDWQGMED